MMTVIQMINPYHPTAQVLLHEIQTQMMMMMKKKKPSRKIKIENKGIYHKKFLWMVLAHTIYMFYPTANMTAGTDQTQVILEELNRLELELDWQG